ncbi:hypothetical protein WICPIJ_002722 [Wickerhamomyces pijperi]|uniref:MIP18 family-like domain-containing protein n=1 Tax=Wickerhamomyces pijperi TaxID=599730 RepID=A0A9P8TPL4_WICPI|nr:hypothetical protein WICPIJ_002722 [Wickerhamomyces pijperi]
MSEVINANPTILDVNALPTREDELNSKSQAPKRLNHNIDTLLRLSLTKLKLNESPTVIPALTDDETSDSASASASDFEELEEFEPIDSQEIYDLIATISDPEHPLTLGQLAVINLPDIKVIDNGDPESMAEVVIKITPTITHCSLATLIGLGIRVRLERALPARFRITILVKEGTHQSENQVNKQLNDKERVFAACENDQLLGVISTMLKTCK